MTVALSLFQMVIEAGALPAFHALLRHAKHSVQKEAAWTISNITAGNQNQIQAVINEKLIPHVVEILKSVSADYQ